MNIGQYFIDKKVYINYEQLSSQLSELGSVNEEIFKMIVNNVNKTTRDYLLKCIYEAIKKKNKNLVLYLFKENAPYHYSLFEAVKTRDIEMVNLVLDHYNDPSFINEKINEGTALHIAVNNQDLQIVKRLLLLPGIDPSLINFQNNDALTLAIKNYNLDIVDAILNFYGDDFVQKKIWMVMEALQTLSRMFTSFGSSVDKRL